MKKRMLWLVAGMMLALGSLQAQDVAGTWQGTLHVPQRDLRTVLQITKADSGGLKGMFFSIDQGGQGIPVTKITFAGSTLAYTIEAIDGTYEGKMAADGKTVTGTWKQGDHPLPLVLERATAETAWAIPEPPPKVVPMAADADPSFEVATIKPSKPDTPGKLFRMQATGFSTLNTTLMDLVSFTYDVQVKEVIGAPDWMLTDKYDLAAKPDTPGRPSPAQMKTMMRKLLADRFQMKFHRDKKELSAFVITVAKTGPKLKKSEGDPNAGGSMLFGKLGSLNVRNSSITDFAHLMQSAVMSRPVVDQTGIEGRYDFLLKWTPDETQFAQMGGAPPPTDAADAPPPLFAALQEQLGLKMEAGKAQVEVLVLDKVEKPSEN